MRSTPGARGRHDDGARATLKEERRSPAGGAKCIVFSTHIMQEVERLCDEVVVVAQGRTVAHGSVQQLLAQTGERDFEEAFVALAFEPVDDASEAASEGSR